MTPGENFQSFKTCSRQDIEKPRFKPLNLERRRRRRIKYRPRIHKLTQIIREKTAIPTKMIVYFIQNRLKMHLLIPHIKSIDILTTSSEVKKGVK